MLRSLLIPAALIALALPSTAAAADPVFYDVHIAANVAYDHVKHAENGGTGSWSEVVDQEWHFNGQVTSDLPMVSFVDGKLQPYGIGGLVEEDLAGRYTRQEEDTWSGPDSLTCDSDMNPLPGGRSGIDPVIVDDGAERIGVRIVDSLSVTGTCDDGRSPGSTILGISGSDAEFGDGPFDALFDLPADAIGNGQIAQRVSGGAAGNECPGFESGVTQSCQVQFDAIITFTRHDFSGVVDPVEQLPAPTPQAPPAPPAPAPTIPRAPSDELIDNVRDAIEDYLDTERIADDIKQAFQEYSNGTRVEMTCSGGCSGSVKTYAQGTPLAGATFRPVAAPRAAAAASTRRMVARLRFDRRDRRLVRRRGVVTVKLAVRGDDGRAYRTTLKVRTRRSK